MLIYSVFFGLLLAFAAGNLRLNHRPGSIWFRIANGVILTGATVFLWNVSDPGSLFVDFNMVYYPAGRLALESPELLYRSPWDDPMPFGEVHYNGLANIPIVAVLFMPFNVVALPEAQILLIALSVAAIGLSCFLAARALPDGRRQILLILAMLAFNGPLYYSIRIGNITHFVLLLIAAAFLCLRAQQYFWTGVLFGIAGILKIPMLLLGFYFLLRGKRQAVLGFVIALCAITGTSLVIFGVDLHRSWYEHCVHPFSGKVVSAFNNQSLEAFLARLLMDVSPLNWQPQETTVWFSIVRRFSLFTLVGGTAWILWLSRRPASVYEECLELSAVLCLAILISPISWTHYYLLLLPSLWVQIQLFTTPQRIARPVILAGTFLISLPVISSIAFFHSESPVLNFAVSRILSSHYFLGGVLLLATFLATRHAAPAARRNSEHSPALSKP